MYAHKLSVHDHMIENIITLSEIPIKEELQSAILHFHYEAH